MDYTQKAIKLNYIPQKNLDNTKSKITKTTAPLKVRTTSINLNFPFIPQKVYLINLSLPTSI